MLREFFLGPRAPLAWSGTLVIVSYSFYLAWYKRKLNTFYGNFYNLLGEAGAATARDGGSGSGGAGSSSSALQQDARGEIASLLFLILPMTLVSPVIRYLRARFAFLWRVTLIEAYARDVWPRRKQVEGSSQRVQEDTARFAAGLSGAVSLLLDTVLSLFVFVPVLIDIGKEATPPAALAFLGDAWLFAVAFGSAVLGLVGSVSIGMPLVGLEVANQVVEADFRKQLLVDEVGMSSPRTSDHDFSAQVRPVVTRLHRNYCALYAAFFRLNMWLGAVEQTAVLLPFVLLTPRLFDEDASSRIQLGVLIKTTDSFNRVFNALSVLSDHWGHLNEFLSVVRRLREFETGAKPTDEISVTELVGDAVVEIEDC